MILKRPYALFIRLFKPIHIVLAILMTYLIYLESQILNCLNDYIHNINFSITFEQAKNLLNDLIFIIPILLIIFSMILLGIMFRKKKPIIFYLSSIISLIIIIIINIYAYNLINLVLETTASIKSVKFIHDLVLINILIESIIVIFYIIRGTGLNFKKFDFSSDLSQLEISESDKEEIEVNVNVDVDEVKRKRKERIRNLKYTYLENKFLISLICGILLFFILIIVSIIIIINIPKKEGKLYSNYPISIMVNSTNVLNKNHDNEKITDNYLIVIDSSIGTNSKVDLDSFKLDIAGVQFTPTTKYYDDLLDLGVGYDKNLITNELDNYLLIYEVSQKYILGDMYLLVNNNGSKMKIKLSPSDLKNVEETKTNKLGEKINFKETIGDIAFKVNSYDIQPSYKLEYNYCYSDKSCMNSYEYIKGSINENFDKAVIKLNVEFYNNEKNQIYDFYDLLNRFGKIYYITGESISVQKKGFERITSKKVKEKNTIYIGVTNSILNADTVYLEFNMRGYKYKYVLKGEI